MDALQVDADYVEQFAEHDPATTGVVVAGVVMAVARVAAGHQHGIRPDLEGLDDQVEIDPPRTRQPDDPDIRRILQPVRPRKVGPQIRAPVAYERNHFRFKSFSHVFIFV